MDIRAALFRAGADTLSLETLQLAEPQPDELVVRLVASGICHTDQKVRETARVPTPIVLGHEGAGIVERVGAAVTGLVPGDHVVMTFDYCGQCALCRDNQPGYCREGGPRCFSGRRPDGSVTLGQDGQPVHGSFFGQSAFATYALCSVRNAVKVRPDAPLELLGPLGCGIQTGAGAVINALKVKAGQSLAVFGAGAVGLSAVMAARLVGATRIVAFDVVESRLALARELGATDAVDARQGSAAEILRDLTGNGVDFALDTTSLLPVMLQAIDALAPRGTFAFVSNTATGEPLPLGLSPLLIGGKQIRGIVQGDSEPHRFIPMLVDYYMQGRFPFDRLVKYYPFEQINQAFDDSHHGSTIKPILRIAA